MVGDTRDWLYVRHDEVQSQGKTRPRRAHSESERERCRKHSWTPPRSTETSESFPMWIRDEVRCVKRCMIAMLQNRSVSGAWEGTTTQEEEVRNCGCSNSVDPGAGN